MLAPIVLFVYNRPEHTQRTLTALASNLLAKESDLFIYSDAAKREEDFSNVNKVRDLIRGIIGFKNIFIIEADQNKGLATSIINGVTEVCNRYGKVIVLEDDIVVSSVFLSFMNQALDKYQGNDEVWHIGGWNYPIDSSDLPDVFFWRIMNCWGWATWADRWKYFDKDPLTLVQTYGQDKEWINYFNLDGSHDFWWQVKANLNKEIDTWAIFWFAAIIQNKGFCMNPSVSYVVNKGFDGSGSHCEVSDAYGAILNEKLPLIWNENVIENQLVVERVREFYFSAKPKLLFRIWIKLKRVLGII